MKTAIMDYVVEFALAAVFVGCPLPLYCVSASYAPPPKYKPIARPSVIGNWEMEWGGNKYPASFLSNGYYCCVWNGKYWQGSWKLDGDTLTVKEGIPDDQGRLPDNLLEWSVTFHGKSLIGRCRDAPFSLTISSKP